MNIPREPRSPLKETIKRSAGQSAKQQIDSIIDDQVLIPAYIAVVVILIAGFEWCKAIWHLPPQPWLISSFAVMTVLFAVWKFKKHRPSIAQLRLGMKGEQEVGQILAEALVGAAVFHDIVCDGFNIDHAVICPNGVFSVETKTRTKRGGTEEKVVYDGEKITVAGFEPDRDAIAQARANANTLAKIILEYTGQEIAVQPVVVFPGWFVNTTVKKPNVWVLNVKGLLAFIRHERVQLTKEQIHVVREGLNRFQNQ